MNKSAPAAGHERYATPEGYVREAEIFKGRVGGAISTVAGIAHRERRQSHASIVHPTVAV